MAFITRGCAKRPRAMLRRLLLLLLLTASSAHAWVKHSDSQLYTGRSTVNISSNFQIELEPKVREALDNGIALTFMYEVELFEPRLRGWWKRQIAHTEQRIVLSFDPILQSYQIKTLSLRLANDLEQALQELGRRQLIQPFDKDALDASKHKVRARLSLDIGSLPGPMRLTAWLNKAWHEDSGWHEIALDEARP